MKNAVLVSPASLLCVFASLGAAQGGVDPQHLVDMAAPGSTVVIPGGDHKRLVISKPLAIVAQPRAIFNQIELVGPGTGTLTLSNLGIGINAVLDLPIQGRGFTELRLQDLEVCGQVRIDGAQYVEVVRCAVYPWSPGPLLEFRGAILLLLDSQLHDFVQPGPSVVAKQTFMVNTQLVGRVSRPSFRLLNDLQLTGEPRIGRPLTLTYQTPGPWAYLYASFGTRRPKLVPGAVSGMWHLAPGEFALGFGPAPAAVDVDIPLDLDWIGLDLAFQVFDPPDWLTRPVSVVVR